MVAQSALVFDKCLYKPSPTMSSKASDAMGMKAMPIHMLAAYVICFVVISAVYHFVAEGEFSSVLTMSVMFQCFGFTLLGLQVCSRGSVAGISGRSLALEALALMLRLSSTTWLNGYLPVDATGDWIYQATDLCSLVLVLWLLRQVLVNWSSTYQEIEDSLPIVPVIIGGLVFGALLHADMNSRPFFDAAWMAGLFIGAVAVLPQLWLVTRTGGQIEALTSHYIMSMAMSRLLSGMFMWHAREDITCEPLMEGFNHAIWAILGAHLLNLLLLGDFAYYYFKAIAKQGLDCQLSFDGDIFVV